MTALAYCAQNFRSRTVIALISLGCHPEKWALISRMLVYSR